MICFIFVNRCFLTLSYNYIVDHSQKNSATLTTIQHIWNWKHSLREGQGKGWRAKQEFADVVSLTWIISFIPIKFIFCNIVSDWQNQFTCSGGMNLFLASERGAWLITTDLMHSLRIISELNIWRVSYRRTSLALLLSSSPLRISLIRLYKKLKLDPGLFWPFFVTHKQLTDTCR